MSSEHATGHGDRRVGLGFWAFLANGMGKACHKNHLPSTSILLAFHKHCVKVNGMDTTCEPQLARPGAGLPPPELLIARMLFALKRATGNRASFTAHFQQERKTIKELVQGLTTKQASQRVLIPRVRGLEDSSRYWSVWMTLEHLRIVHGSIEGVVSKLATGNVPPGEASTAAVKPSPNVTAKVLPAYEKSCDNLQQTLEAIPELKMEVTYAHPWFGPLNAAGWHALSATHIAIHRKQIQAILKAVGGESAISLRMLSISSTPRGVSCLRSLSPLDRSD